MKRTKSLLLILTMLVIVGCASQAPSTVPPISTWTPSPTFPPLFVATLENLFGNSSCSLPCWQGITPGITTSTEALQRLNDSPLVLKDSIQSEESKTGLGNAHWRWKIDDKRPEEKGNIVWANEIVLRMELTAYPNVSVGETINRFGSPEKIDVIDCTDVPEGEHRYWCATLYYAQSGFEIHIGWEGSWIGNDVQITPSDPIEFIRVFKPSTIEEWLSSLGLDSRHRDLRDWKGYGNLLDLYVR